MSHQCLQSQSMRTEKRIFPFVGPMPRKTPKRKVSQLYVLFSTHFSYDQSWRHFSTSPPHKWYHIVIDKFFFLLLQILQPNPCTNRRIRMKNPKRYFGILRKGQQKFFNFTPKTIVLIILVYIRPTNIRFFFIINNSYEHRRIKIWTLTLRYS